MTDSLYLQLQRYLWLPASYAHSGWFRLLGVDPEMQPVRGTLRQSLLNRALRGLRGMPVLDASLTRRQQQLAQMDAKGLSRYALALGLLRLDCNDYFLLPAYRQVLYSWFDETLLWQMFGVSRGTGTASLSPEVLVSRATSTGIAILQRMACAEPVLYAMLILLPPVTRALWPPVSPRKIALLESMLCPSLSCH